MKYLITGGNGFIGSFLKTNLSSTDNVVKTIGRALNNDYQIDLTTGFCEIKEDFDIIIHSASIVHDSSHANSFNQELILKDLEITINLIKTIKNISYKKLIFLSSVSVYGVESGKNIEIIQNLSPSAGYGLSKVISEKLLMESILPEKLLILRLPLVNGPNPKGNIKRVINAIESGKMILFKGNNAKKSILELDDLYLFITEKSLKFSGIHQLKSYDIKFNDFIRGLSGKGIHYLPLILLKFMIYCSRILRLKALRNTLTKISMDLTFTDTTK